MTLPTIYYYTKRGIRLLILIKNPYFHYIYEITPLSKIVNLPMSLPPRGIEPLSSA